MTRLPSGAEVEIFETLDSTNFEARRRADAGEAGPRWFIALQQTAAHGRRGRAWRQAAGDFAGTLLFTAGASERLSQISFIIALAIASTLDEFIPAEAITLKWPNDVLVEGGKIAGLMLEHLGPPLAPRLIIGVGVNIVSAPSDVEYPTARMVDYAVGVPSPEDLARIIDGHFWFYYKDWIENGFKSIRRIWLERARGVGREITVRLPNEEIKGVFEGLDETGALILRSGAGNRIISAGEVFFAPRNGKR